MAAASKATRGKVNAMAGIKKKAGAVHKRKAGPVFSQVSEGASELAAALTELAAAPGVDSAALTSAAAVVKSMLVEENAAAMDEVIRCTVGASVMVAETLKRAKVSQTDLCGSRKGAMTDALLAVTPSKDAKCTAFMQALPLTNPADDGTKDTVALLHKLLSYYDKLPEMLAPGCDLGNSIPPMANDFQLLITEGREDNGDALDLLRDRWNALVDPYAVIMKGLIGDLDAGGVRNTNGCMMTLKGFDKTTRMLRAMMNGKLGMITRAAMWINAGSKAESTRGDGPPQLQCMGGESEDWSYHFIYSTEFSLFEVPIPFVVFGMPVTVTISAASAPFFSAQHERCASNAPVIGVGDYYTVGLIADLETVLSVVVTVGPPMLNIGLGLEIEVLNLGIIWQISMSFDKIASSTRVGPYIGTLAGWVDVQLTIGPWSWAKKIFLWDGLVKQLNAICHTSDAKNFNICGPNLAPPAFELAPGSHPAAPYKRPEREPHTCHSCSLRPSLVKCAKMHCEVTPDRMALMAGMPNLMGMLDTWVEQTGLAVCDQKEGILLMQVCGEELVRSGADNVLTYKAHVGIQWVHKAWHDSWFQITMKDDHTTGWKQGWTTVALGGWIPKGTGKLALKVTLPAASSLVPGSSTPQGGNYKLQPVEAAVQENFLLNGALVRAAEVHLDSSPYPGARERPRREQEHAYVYKASLMHSPQSGYLVGNATLNEFSKAVSVPFTGVYSHSRIQVVIRATSCRQGDSKEALGAHCKEGNRYYTIAVSIGGGTCWKVGRSFPEFKEWYNLLTASHPSAGLQPWGKLPVAEECSVYCNVERVEKRMTGLTDLLKNTLVRVAGPGGKGTISAELMEFLEITDRVNQKGLPIATANCAYCATLPDERCTDPPLFKGPGLVVKVLGVTPKMDISPKLPEPFRYYEAEVTFPHEGVPLSHKVVDKNFEAWREWYEMLLQHKLVTASAEDLKVKDMWPELKEKIKGYTVFERCSGWCNKERVEKRTVAFNLLAEYLVSRPNVVASPVFQKFFGIPTYLEQAVAMGGAKAMNAAKNEVKIFNGAISVEVVGLNPTMEQNMHVAEEDRSYVMEITLGTEPPVTYTEMWTSFPEFTTWYKDMQAVPALGLEPAKTLKMDGKAVFSECNGWCSEERVKQRLKNIKTMFETMFNKPNVLKSPVFQAYLNIPRMAHLMNRSKKLASQPHTKLLHGLVMGGPALTSTAGDVNASHLIEPRSLGTEEEIVLATGQCFDCSLVGQGDLRRLACPRLGLRRPHVFQPGKNGDAGGVRPGAAADAIKRGRNPLLPLHQAVLDFGVDSCLRTTAEAEDGEKFPTKAVAELAFNDENGVTVSVCDERGYANGDYGGWIVVGGNSGAHYFSFRIAAAFTGSDESKTLGFARKKCLMADQSIVVPMLGGTRDKAITSLYRSSVSQRGFLLATKSECLPNSQMPPEERAHFDDGFKAFASDRGEVAKMLDFEQPMATGKCFRCKLDGDSTNCAFKKPVKPQRRMALALWNNDESMFSKSELQKIDTKVLGHVLRKVAEKIPNVAASPLEAGTWGVCDERVYTHVETGRELLYGGVACFSRGMQNNCFRYTVPYVQVEKAAEMENVEEDPLFPKSLEEEARVSAPLVAKKDGDEEYLYLWAKFRNKFLYDKEHESEFYIKKRCEEKPDGAA